MITYIGCRSKQTKRNVKEKGSAEKKKVLDMKNTL